MATREILNYLSQQPILAGIISLGVALIGWVGLHTKGRQDAIAQFNQAILADLESLRAAARAANDRLDSMSLELQQARLDIIACRQERSNLQRQVDDLKATNLDLLRQLEEHERGQNRQPRRFS